MRIQLIVGLIISILFLYISLNGVQLDKLLILIKSSHWEYIPILVIVVLLGFLIRSVRWFYLLRSIKEIRIRKLLSFELIGYAVSNIYPARLGEFVRAYLLGKHEGISGSSALASIVIERVLDGIMVLFLFTLILTFFKLPSGVDRINIKFLGHISLPQLGILALSFYILVISFLVLAYINKPKALKIIEFSSRFLPQKIYQKVSDFMGKFIDGLSVIKEPFNILKALFYTLLLWIVVIYSAELTFYLMPGDFSSGLPFYASALVTILVALILMVPAAPGNIGTLQYGCIISLAIFRIDKTEAFGFSILFHGLQYFIVTISGLFYLWQYGLSLKRLIKERKEKDGSE
ncbi:MAG: flippase-like domain-containing protein [Candidatus Coatesbacteria bacterium]|nr:flippase-like domain-containing protein [Candidatus Coatesbacteria bacterium]